MDKLWKKAVQDRQRRLKPGECQKYVRLFLDNTILTTTYGKHLVMELNRTPTELKYELKQLPIKCCIVWERNMGQLVTDPGAITALSGEWQLEKHVLRILTKHDLNVMIHKNNMNEYHEELLIHYPKFQYILLYLKDNTDKPTKKVTQALLELQVLYNFKLLEIDANSYQNIKDELLRLTKAIAEDPFKQQRSTSIANFKKFLMNDKKQCVRVEGKNGFGRLWQQHLNRLPMVTLEVAEAVIEKYSCPKKLLDDFRKHMKEAIITQLADLKIKRCSSQAIATCDRRVGPAMAQKIYTLYNTTDPDAII